MEVTVSPVSIHPTSLFSAKDCAYRLEEPGPFLLEHAFLSRVSGFSFGLIFNESVLTFESCLHGFLCGILGDQLLIKASEC